MAYENCTPMSKLVSVIRKQSQLKDPLMDDFLSLFHRENYLKND